MLRETPRALFSLHAIARRLQRAGAPCIDAVLMTDMALVAGIDAEKIGSAGFIVRTDSAGSGWRGRRDDGTVERLIAVRTWLPAEAEVDAA